MLLLLTEVNRIKILLGGTMSEKKPNKKWGNMTPKQIEASKKNLQQKGQPSNSPGRPKGTGYKTFAMDLFKEMLESPISYNKKKVQFSEAFAQQVMESATTGGWASKLLFERLFSDNILEDIDTLLNKSKKEDSDFISYRIYKKGHDYQQRLLSTKSRRVYNMAGRRAGKTEANKFKAVDVLLTKEDAKILIIGLTFQTTVDLYFNDIIKLIDDLGFSPDRQSRSEGIIALGEAEIQFKGNSTVDEREKIRGTKWDLVIVDEVQSQKALVYLLDSIINPTLIDKKGQLVLTGTGPRVRGTYWETLWSMDEKALKLNWNLTDNPFIPDHEDVLKEIMEEKGLSETHPLFVREYLGQIAYDDDALVYRLDDNNYFSDEELLAWINTQPVTDLRFEGGLDYGFDDADAVAIILYSTSDDKKWLIYEHKANRTGITEIADAVQAGIDFINTCPLFKTITNKHCNFYADTGGGVKKISFELSTQYNLPILDAYKANKDAGVEFLQEDVRKGNFKVRKGGVFDDEALRTIFARDDNDNLTRVIDDSYHPDLLDAVLYSIRPIQLFYNKR
jgi:hypothetical protein